jgi:hypothetical protein
VKPEREKITYSPAGKYWWRYEKTRPDMVRAIRGLDQVIVITRHSKAVMPALVSSRQVMSEATVVFASDDLGLLALLSGATHYWWSISRGSSIKGDLRYTPSDIFEAIVRPEFTDVLCALGARLDSFRRTLMMSRGIGLTSTYNMVNDEGFHDGEVAELRRIHVAIDEEVMRAYGWTDLDLDHDFHETRQGIRYTVGPVARQEILDRLLELNQQRYAEEQAHGLNGSKASAKSRRVVGPDEDVPRLFEA